MASAITRQVCIKCEKGLGTTTCGGCQQWFCTKHFVKHRQELATQMDNMGQEHDLFQRDLIQEIITHPLLSRINQWEQRSIEKIKAAAEEARMNLQKYLTCTKDQMKTSLGQMTNDLQSSRESDDYTEAELERWMKQLRELRTMVDKPADIEILDDDDEEDRTQGIIRLIQLKENSKRYSGEYPNRLIVGDSVNNNNSIVKLSQAKMDNLRLSRGDIVFVKGNKNRQTVALVLPDDKCSNDHLRINHVLQNNIGVRPGDLALIQPCTDMKYGERIHVRSTNITIQETEDNLFEVYLRPYFEKACRPVHKGDTFIVQKAPQPIEFEVIDTDPSPYCIVSLDTIIFCNGQTPRRITQRK